MKEKNKKTYRITLNLKAQEYNFLKRYSNENNRSLSNTVKFFINIFMENQNIKYENKRF